jgi:hypothetical protein
VNFANNVDFIFSPGFKRGVTVAGFIQTSHDVALAIDTGREMKLFPNEGNVSAKRRIGVGLEVVGKQTNSIQSPGF